MKKAALSKGFLDPHPDQHPMAHSGFGFGFGSRFCETGTVVRATLVNDRREIIPGGNSNFSIEKKNIYFSICGSISFHFNNKQNIQLVGLIPNLQRWPSLPAMKLDGTPRPSSMNCTGKCRRIGTRKEWLRLSAKGKKILTRFPEDKRLGEEVTLAGIDKGFLKRLMHSNSPPIRRQKMKISWNMRMMFSSPESRSIEALKDLSTLSAAINSHNHFKKRLTPGRYLDPQSKKPSSSTRMTYESKNQIPTKDETIEANLSEGIQNSGIPGAAW